MNMKKRLSLALALVLAVSLAACGADGPAVYVQSVSSLAGVSAFAPGDWFAGMVVSENVAEIERDANQSVADLMVKVGDDVRQGQELFSYDTDELQLNLDKQRLELEQLQTQIESYNEQIAELEKERDRASADSKLQYTVEIQTTQVDLKEAELNLQAKQTEVAQSEALLENTTVTSPIAGRIQSINESGVDNYGNPAPYITIQQTGSYRVKGTLGELQMGTIMEGSRIKIVSRTDESKAWFGTVSLIDYSSPTQGNSMGGVVYVGGSSSDEMTSSSRYPFYVALDSTDGLMLGQHVYLRLDNGETPTGPQISSYFLCYEDDGSAYVWAERSGKLEKRAVTLGEYNPATDTYPIVSGLSASDYIAFPDGELCHEGARTTHEEPVEEDQGGNGMEPEGGMAQPEGGVIAPEEGAIAPVDGIVEPEAGGGLEVEDGIVADDAGETAPGDGGTAPVPAEGGEG